MPWKASSVMEERLRFVARLLDGEAMTDGSSASPRRIAGRLKRAALALTHSDFNRALDYPSVGVA